MKANIIRACDMIAVPRKLLFDPNCHCLPRVQPVRCLPSMTAITALPNWQN